MTTESAWRIVRIALTTAALSLCWVVFTASLTPFSLVAGFAAAFAIALFTHDTFIETHEAATRSVLPHPLRLPGFLFLLVRSMYVSSFQVMLAILSDRITPRVVHFRTRLRSDVARVVLANSITFTPGTIAIDLDDDHLTVHWLMATSSHSRVAGESIKGGFEEALKSVWH